MSGFVKIHRAMLDHPVFKGSAERWAFVELITLASWKPKTVRYKDRIINLDRGQCSVSLRDFARKIDGWDDSKVRRFFGKLENHRMIRRSNDAGVTVITICNYCKYQDDTQGTDAPIDAPTDAGPTHHRRTEQEGKEVKEVKEKKEALLSKPNGLDPAAFLAVWNSVCSVAGLPKVRTLKDQRRAKAIKRWREDFGGSVERWGAYCRKIAAAPHLTGDNDRGWKASLGWVIEPGNMEKIQEGNYDGGRKRVDPSLGAARLLGLTGEPMAGQPLGAGLAPDDRGGGGFSNPQLCLDAGGEDEPVVVRPVFPGTRRE